MTSAYPSRLASAMRSRASARALPATELGSKCRRPPPKSTFNSSEYTCSRAISFSSSRSARWLENAAGVACVTRVVVTMPVRLPASCAPSRTVPAGLYDAGAPTPKSRIGTSPITWLSVRNPVAYAVAPAAESVTIEFALRVSHRPTR